jgi:hypothetical protein
VEVAERYADGAATGEDMAAAREAAVDAARAPAAADAAAWAAAGAAWDDRRAAASAAAWAAWAAAGDAALVPLLRCIFGNPFRPMSVDPTWLTWRGGAVPRLAQAAYDERELPSGLLDNGRLTVLADALEDAGCSDPEILGHLRGTEPHVRGCWPVDALLVKE